MDASIQGRVAQRRRPARLARPLSVLGVLAGCLVPLTMSSTPAAASVRGASAAHVVPYGAGKAFCKPWQGLSVGGHQVRDVYPCANPNTADHWNTYQCADYTNRYEWASFGMVAPGTNGGAIVRYLHAHYGVQIQSPGPGRLPRVGDALSMWGNPATTDVAGHTGVVYSVAVDAHGTGSIVYLDQNGSRDSRNRNIGEDTVYVSHWRFSTHWTGYFDYTSFDWTVQATGIANGVFVTYGGHPYRIVGGAPLYVSSWAAVGGAQAAIPLSAAQFGALHRYPQNGAAVSEASGPNRGDVYVFAGGAPLAVNVGPQIGSPSTFGVDPAVLRTFTATGPFSHVRRFPMDGTAVVEASGPTRGVGYVFAGGAPLRVASWADVGSPVPTAVDPVALNTFAATGPFSHVRRSPIDGTAVVESSGSTRGLGYVFAGGAPLRVSRWSSVGSPMPTAVDPVALDHFTSSGPYSHVRRYPVDGTAVKVGTPGSLLNATFVFAGGAPLFVASPANVDSPSFTRIDAAAVTSFSSTGASSHERSTPLDGTFLVTKAAATYRVAGGYAFAIASCADVGGCVAPVLIDAWAVANFSSPGRSHLLAVPRDGTVIVGEPSGQSWIFGGGQRAETSAAGTVEVDDTSLSGFPIV